MVTPDAPEANTRPGFPMVGIGTSAGGLAAFAKLGCGMPLVGDPGTLERAMASGCVDFVLSPEEIAHENILIARAEKTPNTTTSPGVTP